MVLLWLLLFDGDGIIWQYYSTLKYFVTPALLKKTAYGG